MQFKTDVIKVLYGIYLKRIQRSASHSRDCMAQRLEADNAGGRKHSKVRLTETNKKNIYTDEK